MAEPNVPVTVKIPAVVYESLVKATTKERRSQNTIIVDALISYLEIFHDEGFAEVLPRRSPSPEAIKILTGKKKLRDM